MSSSECLVLPCIVCFRLRVDHGEPLQRGRLIDVSWRELRAPGLRVPLITFNCFWERLEIVWSGLPSV
jgi:hypothetical protein